MRQVPGPPRGRTLVSITRGSAPCTTAPAPASADGRAAPGCSAGCCWQSATSCPSQGPLPNSSWPCHVLAQPLHFTWPSQREVCSSSSPGGRAERCLPFSPYPSKAKPAPPKPYLGLVPPSPGLRGSRRAERASSLWREDAASSCPGSALYPQSFASSSPGCSSSR